MDHIPPPGLLQIPQRIEDLSRAVAFYRDTLGIPLIAKFDPPGIAFFDLDGVRLMLDTGPATRSVILYLRVEDIHAEHARLAAAGVAFKAEPHVIHVDEEGHFGAKGTEDWMAFFEDSEGNTLAIAQRVAPSERA